VLVVVGVVVQGTGVHKVSSLTSSPSPLQGGSFTSCFRRAAKPMRVFDPPTLAEMVFGMLRDDWSSSSTHISGNSLRLRLLHQKIVSN